MVFVGLLVRFSFSALEMWWTEKASQTGEASDNLGGQVICEVGVMEKEVRLRRIFVGEPSTLG